MILSGDRLCTKQEMLCQQLSSRVSHLNFWFVFSFLICLGSDRHIMIKFVSSEENQTGGKVKELFVIKLLEMSWPG